jgi:prepilin-type N-terminal cleavage/methylation domain-containing protein
MQTGLKIKSLNNSGFSLMEVLVATTIFMVFITVYVTEQGYNISNSTMIREEIIIRNLGESIINDLIDHPPDLKESLTLSPETKTFEEDKNYEYTLEYERFEIPKLSNIQGEEEEQEDANASGVEAKLFEELKKNMKELIWQVRVTVVNKETGFEYSLAAWLLNPKAKVEISPK